ncbi:hypothetical protein QN277_027114 [Acacia crassicarpa]|uniref:glutathione transferase n=1 Tax=Acacia crassicarpa TaxID=499986 RepID=A0AAE1K7H4_9FABA|nr:hypothetical protein QN277_027114 [Acacia crassicarpa]
MGREDVKVVSFWASLFGRRVEWALKLKGIQYEYIEEDISNKSSLLLNLNPVHKKVPVLLHHQKPIIESCLILEYIDETWMHNPLLPPQPHQKALARFWSKFADETMVDAAWMAMCFSGNEKESALKVGRESMQRIEDEIRGKKFFGGDDIGYLDIALGWISYWLPVWEQVGSFQILDPLKFPAIIAWITNFLNHPVITDSLPPRNELLLYYQRIRSQLSST